MPRFNYICPDGHAHEREYGFTDKKPNAITCHCKKKAARRLEFPLHVTLKGEGWTKGYIGPVKNKVTWGEVEKIMKEADEGSRKAREADIKKYSDAFLEGM